MSTEDSGREYDGKSRGNNRALPPGSGPVQNSQRHKITRSSSGKNISNSRATQLQRTDKVKDVNVGLYDVDEAIYYYLENVVQPRITENDTEVRVPIMYGSPERWKSVQKSGVFRDKTGKLQFPILMYKRTGIERVDGFRKLDANNPNLFYTATTGYNKRNRYDNFNALVGRSPSRESYNVVIPDYVKLTYDCILVTEFISHQNKILEDINYASNAYWGKDNYFKFLANMTSFDLSNDLEDGQDRGIKATFSIEMNGYIIPNNLQKDMTQYNKKSYGVARVIMGNGVHGNIDSLNQALGNDSIRQSGMQNKSSYYNEGSGKSGGMIPKQDILKGHGQKE
tara:strand:+ start:683 stop:1699 length:1017 start_codon:yes stop_codon:yes gene_type:complete